MGTGRGSRDAWRIIARCLLVILATLPLAACGFAAGTGPSQATLACPPPTPGNGATLLLGHIGAVRAIAWSPGTPTGRAAHLLATAGGDGTVRLWSADGALLDTLTDGMSGARSLSWAPDSQTLAVGTDQGLRFWHPNGAAGRTFPIEFGVASVAWSPDGQTLAIGTSVGRVELRNPDGGLRAHLGGHGGRVEALAWSPDGETLASGATDGSIQLWTIPGGAPVTLREHRGAVQALSWRPDGTVFASGSYDATIRLWDAEGMPLATIEGADLSINGIAWSPDGRTFATASHDKTVRLWDDAGTPLESLTGHADVVSAVAWLPGSPSGGSGRTLASSSYDCTIRLWSR